MLTDEQIKKKHDHVSDRKRLLTVKEVAAEFRVSTAWVYAHTNGKRKPKLPALRTGGVTRIHPDDLDAFSAKERSR